MKLALIGSGKTGSQILQLTKEVKEIFNSQNPVTLEALQSCDSAIIFVNAHVLQKMFPILIEARKPLIIGTTGMDWNDELKNKIEAAGITCIYSSNFSLGMNLIKVALENFSKLFNLLENPQVSLSETHHIKKIDKPSGTALAWKKWLGREVAIESIREGDAKGLHNLEIKTEFEKITLSHETLNRALFAKGALWACQFLQENQLPPGLYDFQNLISQHFLGE